MHMHQDYAMACPLDTGCPECLVNVLCTFNILLVSRGCVKWDKVLKHGPSHA